MSAVPSLQVPGYEDSDDEHPEPSTPPLSNPQADHKLLTHQYDSLDELVDDLHEWAAQALFGIRKQRSLNPVKDFGYTRVDFCCVKDKIRPSESIAGRKSSTTKTGCGWKASAKARVCNGRRWTLEIQGDSVHNHAAAEGREDISTFRKLLPEHVAFVTTFVNRPPLAPCTGRFTAQLGIPCRHELLRRHQANDLVLQKEDFHPY